MRNYYFACYNEDGSLKYIPVNGICGFCKVKIDTSLDPKEVDKVECLIDPDKRIVILEPHDIPDSFDFPF